MAIADRWQFLKHYFAEPQKVGALAPSSPALADALCRPFSQRTAPARILEVGAGTGAITRRICELLGDEDHLDICEMESELADILEKRVLSEPRADRAHAQGRIRLMRIPIQELAEDERYDFIISGLPLTAFDLRDVRQAFQIMKRCLKPEGTLSYYEYMVLRRVSRTLALGSKRRRIHRVSAYLNRTIKAHEFRHDLVFGNFPPARARHLRFNGRSNA